jgi:GTP cyclohydrolase II
METPVRYAEAGLPTRWGPFRLIVYRFGGDEELALVRGEVQEAQELLVRIHSECLTGEVLGSLLCDCRAQLDDALKRIAEDGNGAVVYLRQEGRGIGLGNKIRAYALQERGRDTVDANLDLGFSADMRTYERAGAILRDLGVLSARLLTNNPAKIQGLEAAGIPVVGQELIWAAPTAHNCRYLTAKRERLGHVEAASALPNGNNSGSRCAK